MRITVGLRSPLAFQLPCVRTLESLSRPADVVGIDFEGREFVWHPPMDYEDDLGVSQFGPMVAAVVTDDNDRAVAATQLQRFLSAVAYAFRTPVDDGGFGLGGDGGVDAFHPYGSRTQRSHPYVFKADAPRAVELEGDPDLRVPLAYYREGLNATSPFYRCVAFRNVLDAVFDVADESTDQSAARDQFIDQAAAAVARSTGRSCSGRWADYLRDEVRNALAHVNRSGRREVDPDNPHERVRLREDARLLESIAEQAIRRRWPSGVVCRHRDDGD